MKYGTTVLALPPVGEGMSVETPSDIDPAWCPDCGSELSFGGVQSAGIGQFFCPQCRYRHDRYVGEDGATA